MLLYNYCKRDCLLQDIPMIENTATKEFMRLGKLMPRTHILCTLRWQRFHVHVRSATSLL